MSSRRPPATPPELPGYVPDRLLGSGGFSDVFLYRQQMPRREVAVKVLRTVPGADQAEFVDEANLMAHVSSHPAIVTVYHADVAADGRPYLVMEYCAGPNLSERYRSDRLGVAEALRIGVRLAGAVETAHRAGILHRDIKPANVLTNDYGWPALTDFGISVMGAGASETETGMSIPWAAPEFFADDSPRGVTADVYSLAATLYTVLAGRSPFEVVGGSNAAFDLISRITREDVAPIGRQDVPGSLENVLARAMDKRPARRFATALDLGRALQRVELELHLAPTPIDVPDVRKVGGQTGAAASVVFGETQVRPVIDIDPSPGTAAGWTPGTQPTRPLAGQGQERQPFTGVAGYSVTSPTGGQTAPVRVPRRPDDPSVWEAPAQVAKPWEKPTEQEVDPHELPPVPRRPWLGVLVGGAVVAIAVTAVVMLNLNGADEPETPFTPTAEPTENETVATGFVPEPDDVRLTRSPDEPTTLIMEWVAPEGVPDATFTYRVTNSDEPSKPVASSPLVLDGMPSEATCVELRTRTPQGQVSQPFTLCV
ncbi:serine/threonine protein kinase [Serinibacter arcticus]|uniref:non-specific serine/threonine protein kinase n=1 Tax=Serinibacter arcticus TaxID=1655435 RepID=A0A2U1ZR71_9MICO|nr:serine/threonine-protein kinase [Serinibacter arcticus]PWD49489.1 serine/threonine protein kinase [Serinibacter arcticus]